jgi:hypothetical protein
MPYLYYQRIVAAPTTHRAENEGEFFIDMQLGPRTGASNTAQQPSGNGAGRNRTSTRGRLDVALTIQRLLKPRKRMPSGRLVRLS